MINEAFELVKEFQKQVGQPVSEYPQKITDDRIKARIKWLRDEINELEVAKNVYEQADALIDLLYYLLGAFVELGLHPDEMFKLIHHSNMEKISINQEVNKDSELKVQKPIEWRHPDKQIKKIIDEEVELWQKK